MNRLLLFFFFLILSATGTNTNRCNRAGGGSCSGSSSNNDQCIASECSSGCCIDNVCATASSDCGMSLQTLLIVCVPFGVVISLIIVGICIWVVKKRRRRVQLQVVPQDTPQANRLNVAQGIPVQAQNRGEGRIKIVPINTAEVTCLNPNQSVSLPPSPIEFKTPVIFKGSNYSKPDVFRPPTFDISPGLSVEGDTLKEEE